MANRTASKVAHTILLKRNTHTRVAARFVEKTARTTYEHKIVGNDARFLWGASHGWSQPEFLIEELPQKGKKKLGRWKVSLQLGLFLRWLDMSTIYFGADEMARKSKIGPSDNYKTMVSKLERAFEEESEKLFENFPKESRLSLNDVQQKWKNMLGYYPSEEDVFYLNVMPEGVEPFSAQGKDFTIDVGWTTFKSYSPNSDFESHDPSYSYYHETSPGAARLLYKLLKANPDALKSVGWIDLSDFLRKNRIGYDTQRSVWH